jgi:hypothetical protein
LQASSAQSSPFFRSPLRDIRGGPEERTHTLHAAIVTRKHQSRPAILRRLLDVCAGLDERLHTLDVAIANQRPPFQALLLHFRLHGLRIALIPAKHQLREAICQPAGCCPD